MKVEGITAIVTGGASGIGEATIRLLISKGARVIFGDINYELGVELEAELNKKSKVCKFIPCDVRIISNLELLFDAANREFGPVQFVFNNAGICERAEDLNKPERISNLIAINLTAVVHGCQLAHKHFNSQLKEYPDRQFCIINTSSYSAVMYAAEIPVYTTTKAAIKTLTNTLAHCEWENTRINAIAPSLTETRIVNDFPPGLTEVGKDTGFMTANYIAQRVLRILEDDTINGELMTIDPESDEFADKPVILPLLKSNL